MKSYLDSLRAENLCRIYTIVMECGMCCFTGHNNKQIVTHNNFFSYDIIKLREREKEKERGIFLVMKLIQYNIHIKIHWYMANKISYFIARHLHPGISLKSLCMYGIVEFFSLFAFECCI